MSGRDGSGVTTYTFDESGNQRTVEVPSGDLTIYAWDFENQLVSVENPLNEITTYAYTGLDQRLSAETEDATTKFLWDGQNLLAEYDDLDVTQAVWTLDPQPGWHWRTDFQPGRTAGCATGSVSASGDCSVGL